MIIRYYKVPLAYAAVLLIALIAFYALPQYPQSPDIFKGEEFSSLIEKAAEGKLAEAERIAMVERWEFQSQEKTLTVTSAADNMGTVVVVSRSGTEQDKIIINEYINSPLIIGRIPPYKLSLRGKELVISSPPELKIKLYSFSRDILAQFSPKTEQSHLEISGFLPDVLLYLQVPAGMEVKADEFGPVHLIFAEEQ